MVEVRRTEFFDDWLRHLDDARAKAKIAVRIDRLAAGNPGDVKAVGGGVRELRIDFGPGYRVYFVKQGKELIILLAGGDKKSQARDIKAAIAMAAELKE